MDNKPEGVAWVIDPFMMIWSSFANVAGPYDENYSYDVSYDQSGNLYICGKADTAFPATAGAFQTVFGGGYTDAYVAKYSPDGSNLTYMTYIGGNSSDVARSLAATATGEVFFAGSTSSSNFPVTPGALATSNPRSVKPFIAKLNSTGNNLVYSTFACDSCYARIYALAAVSNGEVIVTGSDLHIYPFPTTPGAFMTAHAGGWDAWVARYNASGSAIQWGTHFGSSQSEDVWELAVNDLEEPYIVGTAGSMFASIPVTPGTFQGPGVGGFVTRFNANGTGLIYSSYFGTDGHLTGLDVHPTTREAYVVGFHGPGAPVTQGVIQPTFGGFEDAVIARISADGSNLIYSTYFGGSAGDFADDIAVNQAGEAYVMGFTNSLNYPYDSCQLQQGVNGFNDVFLLHLDPQGENLLCGGSAVFGGAENDYYGTSIKVREDGMRDTLICSVTSHSPGFPTTPGSFQPIKLNGVSDCPVALKLAPLCPGPNTLHGSTICGKDSMKLHAPGQATNLLWSNSDTASFIWINQPGQYWVEGLINNCPFSDTFNISQGNLPVNLGSDTVVCDLTAFSLPLNAGIGSSWLWSNSSTSSSIVVNQPGAYWVSIYDSVTGCVGSDTLLVQQILPPTLNLTAAAVCPGDSVVLDADPFNNYPGGSYYWSTNALTQQEIYPSGSLAWVDLTVGGCTTRDSFYVPIHPQPSVSIGPDTTLCDTNVFTANTGPGYTSWLWSNADTTQSANFTQSGTVWVETVDTNGCMASDTLTLNLAQQSPPNLGPDQTLCTASPFFLYTGSQYPGASYLWHNNDTTPSIADPISSGWAWVQVTTLSGCVLHDSVFITRIPLPAVNIGPDTTICDTNVFIANAGPGYSSYIWSNTANTPSTFFTTSGLVFVQVSDTNGCVNRDSLQLTFAQQAPPNLGPDTSFCPGGSLSIGVTGTSGNTYLWNTGATTSMINASSPGNYWLNCTNTATGCSAVDTIMVTPLPGTTSAFTLDAQHCPQIFFTDNSTNATSWSWSFGDGSTSVLPSPSHSYLSSGNGTYTVTLISNGPCNSDTSTQALHIDCVVGIALPESLTVKVFPNPNLGSFQVEFSSLNEDAHLRVFNEAGQLVFDRMIIDKRGDLRETVDLLHPAAGTYLIDLSVGDLRISRKIVIE